MWWNGAADLLTTLCPFNMASSRVEELKRLSQTRGLWIWCYRTAKKNTLWWPKGFSQRNQTRFRDISIILTQRSSFTTFGSWPQKIAVCDLFWSQCSLFGDGNRGSWFQDNTCTYYKSQDSLWSFALDRPHLDSKLHIQNEKLNRSIL